MHHEDAGDEAEGELQVAPEDEVERLDAQAPAPAEVSADVVRRAGEDEAGPEQDDEENQETPQELEEHGYLPKTCLYLSIFIYLCQV